ncbi:MAG: DUF1573 domain-containing protein [Opitutaceae bacterium]|jgi:hypothetical protein
MHLRARSIVLLILSLFIAAKLNASALQWDGNGKIHVEFVEGRQKKVKVGFTFKNAGDHPVSITRVKTDCKCVTAELGRKTIAAGGRGLVIVLFDVEGLTGLQEKYITVTTDEPNEQPARLLLQVIIKTQ